jgi:addiction module HigA family antidote
VGHVSYLSSAVTDGAPLSESGSVPDRDQLLLVYLPTVHYLARQIHARLSHHVELDDLISAGVVGLIDAFSKFDNTKQVQFKSNVQFRIRAAILDSLRTMSRSSTTTKTVRRSTGHRLPPIHPGEMLREEFLVPMGLSANALAIAIGVPATRVGEIVNERRGITADTALRLGRYFHMTPEFWMNLQSHYDLQCARNSVEKKISQSVKPAPLDRKTGALKAVLQA